MTLEERVSRLERQFDTLERLEARIGAVEIEIAGLRADLRGAFERIFASLDDLNRKPGFRWWWESR